MVMQFVCFAEEKGTW